jgi:hypothetical protein
MGEVAVARKGKRLIIVNLGDSVDGIHHLSVQESLFSSTDQAAAHIELMREFMKRTGYSKKKGDELHYIQGTESHVGDIENEIGETLGAQRTKKTGLYVSDVLTLNINGTQQQFLHHGRARGDGANEGNGLRNWMRNIHYDRQKEGMAGLDAIWTGHTHAHTYTTHISRERDQFHVMHGIICPSWQCKTRYAYAKVPQAVNSVGMVYTLIDVDGEIHTPHFVVQAMSDD